MLRNDSEAGYKEQSKYKLHATLNTIANALVYVLHWRLIYKKQALHEQQIQHGTVF